MYRNCLQDFKTLYDPDSEKEANIELCVQVKFRCRCEHQFQFTIIKFCFVGPSPTKINW